MGETNLREEIEKVFKDVKIFPEGLGYGKDSNVSHWRIVKFGELERLVRSWALECVGEDDKYKGDLPDDRRGLMAIGYNGAKQAIREKIETEAK